MMTNYNKYGEVAINIAKAKGNEVKKAFIVSTSSQKKKLSKKCFFGFM